MTEATSSLTRAANSYKKGPWFDIFARCAATIDLESASFSYATKARV